MKKIRSSNRSNGPVQCTGYGSRAGRFFWPIGNAKSGRRIPGAERQRNDRRKRKILRDDTWVTLRGHIVERISDDLYVFKRCQRYYQCGYRSQTLERCDGDAERYG